MAVWQWMRLLPRQSSPARGQGLVEYALLLIFVAVVLIALLTILGPGLGEIYQNIIDNL